MYVAGISSGSIRTRRNACSASKTSSASGTPTIRRFDVLLNEQVLYSLFKVLCKWLHPYWSHFGCGRVPSMNSVCMRRSVWSRMHKMGSDKHWSCMGRPLQRLGRDMSLVKCSTQLHVTCAMLGRTGERAPTSAVIAQPGRGAGAVITGNKYTLIQYAVLITGVKWLACMCSTTWCS